MDEVIVRTDVYVPPAVVFEFLRDFRGYARYSSHLKRVEQDGDGGPGTRYTIELFWWRITYTAETEVTAIDEHSRIEWAARSRAMDATGAWLVEPLDDAETRSRVTLSIRYDPASADASVVPLPPFISVGWVIDRVRPLLEREAEAVVERIVEDLEGEPRSVDLRVETRRR